MPSGLVLFKDRGNELFKEGRWQGAIDAYSAGIRAAPLEMTHPDFKTDQAILFNNRAAALVRLNDLDNAILDTMAAAECNPSYSRALERGGEIYLRLQEYGRSGGRLQRAVMYAENETARKRCQKLLDEALAHISSTNFPIAPKAPERGAWVDKCMDYINKSRAGEAKAVLAAHLAIAGYSTAYQGWDKLKEASNPNRIEAEKGLYEIAEGYRLDQFRSWDAPPVKNIRGKSAGEAFTETIVAVLKRYELDVFVSPGARGARAALRALLECHFLLAHGDLMTSRTDSGLLATRFLTDFVPRARKKWANDLEEIGEVLESPFFRKCLQMHLQMLMKDLVDRESTKETTDALRRAGEALMDECLHTPLSEEIRSDPVQMLAYQDHPIAGALEGQALALVEMSQLRPNWRAGSDQFAFFDPQLLKTASQLERKAAERLEKEDRLRFCHLERALIADIRAGGLTVREFYARTKELEESYVAGEPIFERVQRNDGDSHMIRETAVQLRIMVEWKAQNPKSPQDLILVVPQRRDDWLDKKLKPLLTIWAKSGSRGPKFGQAPDPLCRDRVTREMQRAWDKMNGEGELECYYELVPWRESTRESRAADGTRDRK